MKNIVSQPLSLWKPGARGPGLGSGWPGGGGICIDSPSFLKCFHSFLASCTEFYNFNDHHIMCTCPSRGFPSKNGGHALQYSVEDCLSICSVSRTTKIWQWWFTERKFVQLDFSDAWVGFDCLTLCGVLTAITEHVVLNLWQYCHLLPPCGCSCWKCKDNAMNTVDLAAVHSIVFQF